MSRLLSFQPWFPCIFQIVFLCLRLHGIPIASGFSRYRRSEQTPALYRYGCDQSHTARSARAGCRSHMIINKKGRSEAENRCERVWETGNLITMALVFDYRLLVIVWAVEESVALESIWRCWQMLVVVLVKIYPLSLDTLVLILSVSFLSWPSQCGPCDE